MIGIARQPHQRLAIDQPPARVTQPTLGEHQIDLVGPLRGDVSWQAKEATGYDLTAFHIDWEARTVTCPQGQVATDWEVHLDRWGGESNHVCFPRPVCGACPPARRAS